MKKYLIVALLQIGAFDIEIFGQDLSSIQTDRPDQTECPFTVPKKHFQVETGFTFERTDVHSQTYSIPTILWKYGVNENVEVRLITEFSSVRLDSGSLAGISPVTIGFKAILAKENGPWPAVSFLGHLSIPWLAAPKMQSTYYAPAFRFSLQHSLSKKFSLGYNFGAEWDGESAQPTFIYTLTTGYSITEKINSYIEIYGFSPQKEIPDHRFDCGLSYLLKQNMLVDISGGLGISANAPGYYGAVGFSFRLPD